LEVSKKGARGQEILGRLGPGTIIGELAFLDGALKRTASAQAASDGCCVIALRREELESLLFVDPSLVYKVMRAIVRSVHRTVLDSVYSGLMHDISGKLVGAFIIGAIALGASTTLYAQQAGSASQGVDVGKYLYESHCAICHGSSGTGSDRGPYWSKPVPDLTTLSNRNGGVFPFMRVYETIDGRNEVQTHGPRDMPVWGKEFTAQSLDLSP